jgi:oxygen-dependent protoporphyrinogen oxidase
MGELQQALIGRLRPGVRLAIGQPVTRISREGSHDHSGYRVESPAGTESFDAVILALPAYTAAELVGPWQSELAAELSGIEYASSVVVVTGHKLTDIAHPMDAYGLVVPARERRMILAVSFQSRKFPDSAPPGRIVLRTFIGGALQPELFEKSDEDLRAIVSASLSDIFGARGAPEVCRVAPYPRAMPQYHVGHLDRIRRIEALQSKTPGLHLCGNAYRGVGIPDCIADGERAAGAAWARLQASARGN